MKRLVCFTLFTFILLCGCNKTYDLDGAALGQDRGDFIVPLYKKAKITSEYDNTLKLQGVIPLFGTTWEKGSFTFEDDKLAELSVSRPFSSIPESSINRIKKIMKDKCGGAYTDYASNTVVYGSDREKDCQGAIMVNIDDDILFVTIKIIR